MKTLIAVVLLVAVCSPVAFGHGAIPLEQAVKDGKVEVEVTGIGGSTGDRGIYLTQPTPTCSVGGWLKIIHEH